VDNGLEEPQACGSLRIKIGDITFDLNFDSPTDRLDGLQAYGEFLTSDEPDVTLQIRHESLPDVSAWEQVFDSGGVWSLSQNEKQWAFCFRTPILNPDLYQVAVFDRQFERGKVTIREYPSNQPRLQFDSILPEILTVNLLSRGAGVLVHACGVKDGPVGRLFAGNSGAGKSTMARQWAGLEGVQLLSDDRVIVRQREGRFWIYGTPWHGDVHAALPLAAPLEQVFILKQTPQNQVNPIQPTEATAQLLVRVFPTFWNPQGMAFTLQFLAEMSQAVPCYELGFVPDPSVVSFVRCLTPV
jgi:hypothetical protein